jgi:hypothetical protein
MANLSGSKGSPLPQPPILDCFDMNFESIQNITAVAFLVEFRCPEIMFKNLASHPIPL